MRKRLVSFAIGIAILAMGIVPAAVWANTVNTAATVTVQVPAILSISDNGTGNFTLTFQSAAAGGTTNGQTVGYAVQANSMPNSALTGALSAKISALLSGITIRANSGRTYTNNGSASNAVLQESSAGLINLGTTAVNIMDKPASTGNSGKILSGTAFINWGAVADRDLTTTDGGSVTLTVTLKDA